MHRRHRQTTLAVVFGGFCTLGIPSAEAEVSKEVEIRVSHRLGEVHVVVAGRETTGEHGLPLKDGLEIELPKRSNVTVRVVDTNFIVFEYGLERKTVDAPWTEELATFGQALGAAFGAAKAARAPNADGDMTMSGIACQKGEGPSDSLQKAINQLTTLAAERKQIVGASLSDPADEVKPRTSSWKLAEHAEKLATIRKKRLELDADLLACIHWITFIDANLPKANALLEELKAFDKALQKLGEPITLDGFRFEPGKFENIKVQVTAKEAWAAEQKASSSFEFVGNATISVQPRSLVDISVTPTAVYSFVRDPSFEVVEDAGALSIQKKEEPYKKLDLAAMLQIEPHSWDLGPVGVGVQLGVAPAEDLGFFLGLALRSGKLFTFGAGIAFQEVERLAPGLSEGPIASRDLLKTETDFDSGLYLHIGVTLGGNKK